MSDNTYQMIKFPVNDFREFTGQPRNNYYQIKKLVSVNNSNEK